jgi:hypothetical protein
LRRFDGHAIEEANGDQYWYKEGYLHHSDGVKNQTI